MGRLWNRWFWARGCAGSVSMEYIGILVVLSLTVTAVAVEVPGTNSRYLTAAVCKVFGAAARQSCAEAGPAKVGASPAGPTGPTGSRAQRLVSQTDPNGVCTPITEGPHEQVPAQGGEDAYEHWVESNTCTGTDGTTETCTRDVKRYTDTGTSIGIGILMTGWSCTPAAPPPPPVVPTTPATAPDGAIQVASCTGDQTIGPPLGSPATGQTITPHSMLCTDTSGGTRQCDRDTIVYFAVTGGPEAVRLGPLRCSAPLTVDQATAVGQGADVDYIYGDDECASKAGLTPEAAEAAEKAVPVVDTMVDARALHNKSRAQMTQLAALLKQLTGRDPRTTSGQASFAASEKQFQQALILQNNPALADEIDQLDPIAAEANPVSQQPGKRGLVSVCRQWLLHMALIAGPKAIELTLAGFGVWQNMPLMLQEGFGFLANTWTATGFAGVILYQHMLNAESEARTRLLEAHQRGAPPAEIATLQREVQQLTVTTGRFVQAIFSGFTRFFAEGGAQVAPEPGLEMAEILHQAENGIVQPAVDEHGFVNNNPVFPGNGAGG